MARMGSSLETPSFAAPDCPLCSRECWQPSHLPCGHCFCRTCIQEVWSSSQTGPYYCPECRAEYRKMPALDRRAEEAQGRGAFSTSDGEMPSTSTKGQGKRRAPPSSRTAAREGGNSPPSVPPPSSPTSAGSAGPGGSVSCSYCPSPRQQAAVKTCLVCEASMCAAHLRPHLEAPVFQAHPLVAPAADISVWRCAEHQEARKIYCRDCAACVCAVCTVIGAHRDHACVGVAEAEGELRGKLKDDMGKMKENEQVICSRMTGLQEKEQNIQETLDQARGSLEQQYQAMREALDRQEVMTLQAVEREERRVLGGVQAQMELLQEELRSIQTSLDSLEKLSNSKGAEQVKGQAFIMEYSKVLESVKVMSGPLEELEPPREVDHARLGQLVKWAEGRLNSLLQDTMDRDVLRLLYGITPSLDPDTAHAKLVLSEGCTRVTYADEAQPYPDRPTRFTNFPQVLGARARDGGRSYWEVEVSGDGGRWKVGVCDGLLGRKGPKDTCRIGFNPHSWCLFGERGKMEALHNKVSFPVEGVAPRRVGVLLDMEEGNLSFYAVPEVGALTLLHSFVGAFAQPLLPALAVSKMELAFCHLFQ